MASYNCRAGRCRLLFLNWLRGWGAVGVFAFNIAIYARRFALRHAAAHTHRPAH